MATAVGLRQVGYFDCAGGGQVIVQNGVAFIGHMRAPHGTSIVDVRDPKNPQLLAEVSMPPGTHSHKVRVEGDVMIVNREINNNDSNPRPQDFRGGLNIYDIANPRKPQMIGRWDTAGQGVHRFDSDARYAYISSTAEGYLGHLVIIIDLEDPKRPTDVARWWMPGQWTAGGEQPSWERTAHRCHHPLRRGNRLYTSYWQAGFVILDVEDITKPKRISGMCWQPPYICPTHTALPLPFEIRGRRYMVVADEDVVRPAGAVPAFMWTVDITDETHPVAIGSFQVEGLEDAPQPPFTACHQPSEIVTGTEIPFAWFACGLRVIDVSNPHVLREVACFMPDVPPDTDRVQANDVTVDDRGLIYLIDRRRGLTIVERV
jgi:hypothetical protein